MANNYVIKYNYVIKQLLPLLTRQKTVGARRHQLGNFHQQTCLKHEVFLVFLRFFKHTKFDRHLENIRRINRWDRCDKKHITDIAVIYTYMYIRDKLL